MTEELRELGKKLCKKREEMQLTLKEASNSTSIRVGFLQAIEEGTIHKFLASVYAIGFIKQYASFLGFNIEKVIKDYPSAFNAQKLDYEFNYGIGTLEMRSSFSGGIKWLPRLLWAGGIGFFIIITYYIVKAMGCL